MLQKLDLASIAEEIVSPYRPIPLVSLSGMEASLFVCQGARSWHRQVAEESLLVVLEGVITVEGPAGRTIVNEGEVASVPRQVAHNAYSGMRSTVMLVEERAAEERSNGSRSLPYPDSVSIGKVNVAVDVRRARPFVWQPAGQVGQYSCLASRLRGTSTAYTVPAGSLLLLVYRGMLDYQTPDEAGTAVGSQLLVASPGTSLTLTSEHGATVVALAHRSTALPGLAPGSPRDAEAGGAATGP